MNKFNEQILQKLQKGLSLSVVKKANAQNNSVSIAISTSGKSYLGGKIESDTNLLDISSEHSALALALAHRDYKIEQVITLVENDSVIISPLILKILVDFGIRTKKPVRYIVQNKSGQILFKTNDSQKEIPFYKPVKQILTLSNKKLVHNFKQIDPKLSKKILVDELRKLALVGLESAFTTKDGSSRYGVAVATGSGKVYFAGQYSSPDKRLGLHGEVSATLTALMKGERAITHIAIVSDKFPDTPALICGCCRQWLSELALKFKWNLHIICFAKMNSSYTMDTIESLLPRAWSSKT